MDSVNFEKLLASTKEAREIIDGQKTPSRSFVFEIPDPKKIRAKLKLTQIELAELMCISVGTLRGWEQGRRLPDGPARVLLHLVDKNPDIFDNLKVKQGA